MYTKAFIPLLIGLIFAGVGIYICWTPTELMLNGLSSTAKVIEIEESIDSKGDTMYTPKFQYQCGSEELHEQRSNIKSNTSYSIDEIVNIKCDPQNSEKMTVMETSTFVLFLLPVIGIAISIFGIILLKKAIKISAKKKRLKEIWIQLTLNITGIHESWVIINGRKEYLIDVEHKGEILTSDEGIFSPINSWKITVYMNPTDPSEYWIDTKSIIEEE